LIKHSLKSDAQPTGIAKTKKTINTTFTIFSRFILLKVFETKTSKERKSIDI